MRSHIAQHLREATRDHDNGLFAGTDDIVERLTGRKPASVDEFVTKHRAYFASHPKEKEQARASV